MKIILLENIKGIGNKWDIKQVKNGYARNFLLPKKLAKIATKEAVKGIEKEKAALKKRADNLKDALEEVAKKFSGKEFYFYPEIGEHQEVFTPVGKSDIKEAMEKRLDFVEENLRKEVSKKIKINLTRSLKELGSHPIGVSLSGNVKFEIIAVLNQHRIEE